MIVLPSRFAAVVWTDIVNAQPIKDLRGAQMAIANETGYVPETFRVIEATLSSIFETDEFERHYKDLLQRAQFSGSHTDCLMAMMWGSDPSIILDDEVAPYGDVILEAGETSYFEGAQVKFTGCM